MTPGKSTGTAGGGRGYAIIAGDFVRTGGMDVANHALAAFLANQGRTVDLVAYRVAEDLASQPTLRAHLVPKPAGAYALGAPLLGLAGIGVAARVAHEGGTVIVNGGNCSFPATNWVHYVHAAYRPALGQRSWRSAKAHALHGVNLASERLALRIAKVVIANSERTRRHIIDLVGVAEERTRTVYYGTDPERFRPATPAERADARRELGWNDDRPRVVFIGALGDRRKGFDVVYAAWRTLCARPSWDANLVVVGAGAELAAWRGRAERDGLVGRIDFLGFRRDVPRVLAASDALVAPARYEAYGLGVHEALCCGLPALVAAHAGVAERLPPSLSHLALEDVESPSALADGLMRWREHASQLRADTLSFSGDLRKRSWNDMAGDIVSICEARV